MWGSPRGGSSPLFGILGISMRYRTSRLQHLIQFILWCNNGAILHTFAHPTVPPDFREARAWQQLFDDQDQMDRRVIALRFGAKALLHSPLPSPSYLMPKNGSR